MIKLADSHSSFSGKMLIKVNNNITNFNTYVIVEYEEDFSSYIKADYRTKILRKGIEFLKVYIFLNKGTLVSCSENI